MDEDYNNYSMQIKEELEECDEQEMYDIVINNSSTLETDPMDLLELVEQRDYFDERSASEHYSTENGDDSSNATGSNEDRFTQWSEDCPWLLHERHYGQMVYCLYCNMTLSAKAFYYIKQHDSSANHKEREHCYKEFKRSLGQTALSDSSLSEIKEELGTTSTVAAMRHKRMLEDDMFNNFNWQCWLQEHEWLVRDQLTGYSGYCKYCKIRIQVEFSYQRKRHEEYAKHKKAEKLLNQKTQPGARQTQDNNISDENHHKEGAEDEQEKETADTQKKTDESTTLDIPTNTSQQSWFESTSTDAGHCRLCLVKLTRHSFLKHLKTKIHEQNLHLYRMSRNSTGSNIDEQTKLTTEELKNRNLKKWDLLEKVHPWLEADPDDFSFAYCKYCKKRFMYGHSAVKRAMHENSSGHKMAVAAYANSDENKDSSQANHVENKTASQSENNDISDDDELASNTANESDNEQEEESENNDEQQEESASDDEENNKDDDDKKQARLKRGSDEWFALVPWCKKIPKNPNMLYCIYCKIKMSLTNSRRKHAESLRHTKKEQEFTTRSVSRRGNTRGSSIYPWLARLKTYPNSAYCKYCRIRFSNSFSRTKHESSLRHKEATRAYVERQKKRMKQEEEKHVKSNDKAVPPTSPTNPVKNKEKPTPISNYAKIMLWRQKYNWLSYKRSETRSNYVYCKKCEISIYVPTLNYAKRHQIGAKHLGLSKKFKHTEKVTSNAANNEDSSLQEVKAKTPEKHKLVRNRRNESVFWQGMQKQFSWLQPGKRKKKGSVSFGFCEVCKLPVMVNLPALKKHVQSSNHLASLKQMSENDNTTEHNTEQCADTSLESTQLNDEGSVDELASDKSEEPPTKRLKSALETAKRLTNAHSEILNLTRVLNGTLGIDGVTHATPPAATALIERNSFDLFFESVSETFKKFPSDLAAEGKMKVMQLVYDLEMRAFRRKEAPNSSEDNIGLIQPTSTSTSGVVEENHTAITRKVIAAATIQTNGAIDDENLVLPTDGAKRNCPVLVKQTTPNSAESSLSKDGNVRRIVLNSMTSKYVIRDGKISYMVSPRRVKTTSEQEALNREETARRFIDTTLNGSDAYSNGSKTYKINN